jgi:hypothetical protein
MSIASAIPYSGDAIFDVVEVIELWFGALRDRRLDPRQVVWMHRGPLVDIEAVKNGD